MISSFAPARWLNVSNAYEADGTVRGHIRLSAKQTKGSEARTVLLNQRMQDEQRLYARMLTQGKSAAIREQVGQADEPQ